MNKTKSFTKVLSLLMALLMFSSVMILPVSAASAPAAPSQVTAASNTSAIKLTWSKVSGATGYRIYYKLPGDISWRQALSSTTATTHTFNNLPCGQSYLFAVRSYNKTGSTVTWGGYKEIAAATQTVAPKNISAAQNTSAIKLSWTERPEATGYRIYYKTSANADWKTALSSTKSTTHTFTGLPAGKKYIFAVRGYIYSAFGTFYGAYNTIETATVPATPTAKGSTTSSSISLSWNKVSADGYRIYYKTAGSSWKTALSTTTKTSHTFSGLPSGKTYTLAVRPYIKIGSTVIWGGYKEFNVTTKAVVKIPTSKAEAVAVYNNAVNNAKVYTDTVKLKKNEIINVEVYDLPSITASVIKPVIQNLTRTEPQEWTFKNGVDVADPTRRLYDKIAPYGREANIKAEGIKSAAVKANSDGGFTLKMQLIPETSVFNGTTTINKPTYHMGAMDVLEFGALDLGPITITAAETYYPGAAVTATVDAYGRLVKLVNELPFNAYATGKAGISITLNMGAEMNSEYRFTYA